MRPDDREIDDEIRGHLALSVKERIERGEDPEAARLAALREFGYIPAARESISNTTAAADSATPAPPTIQGQRGAFGGGGAGGGGGGGAGRGVRWSAMVIAFSSLSSFSVV